MQQVHLQLDEVVFFSLYALHAINTLVVLQSIQRDQDKVGKGRIALPGRIGISKASDL